MEEKKVNEAAQEMKEQDLDQVAGGKSGTRPKVLANPLKDKLLRI